MNTRERAELATETGTGTVLSPRDGRRKDAGWTFYREPGFLYCPLLYGAYLPFLLPVSSRNKKPSQGAHFCLPCLPMSLQLPFSTGNLNTETSHVPSPTSLLIPYFFLPSEAVIKLSAPIGMHAFFFACCTHADSSQRAFSKAQNLVTTLSPEAQSQSLTSDLSGDNYLRSLELTLAFLSSPTVQLLTVKIIVTLQGARFT